MMLESNECAICGYGRNDWEPLEREFKIHPALHNFVPKPKQEKTNGNEKEEQ